MARWSKPDLGQVGRNIPNPLQFLLHFIAMGSLFVFFHFTKCNNVLSVARNFAIVFFCHPEFLCYLDVLSMLFAGTRVFYVNHFRCIEFIICCHSSIFIYFKADMCNARDKRLIKFGYLFFQMYKKIGLL